MIVTPSHTASMQRAHRGPQILARRSSRRETRYGVAMSSSLPSSIWHLACLLPQEVKVCLGVERYGRREYPSDQIRPIVHRATGSSMHNEAPRPRWRGLSCLFRVKGRPWSTIIGCLGFCFPMLLQTHSSPVAERLNLSPLLLDNTSCDDVTTRIDRKTIHVRRLGDTFKNRVWPRKKRFRC